MIIINKPKHTLYALDLEGVNKQLEVIISEYQQRYPNFKVKMSIEPDPNNVLFNSKIHEFIYKVSVVR